jgi:hypothetical protein
VKKSADKNSILNQRTQTGHKSTTPFKTKLAILRQKEKELAILEDDIKRQSNYVTV